MKVEQFCELLKSELNEEGTITYETNFKELENYGSLSAIAILQLVETHFNVQINPRGFRNIKTVQDLIEAIGVEKFS